MNNKKLNIWLPLLFSIVMILGMFFGYKMRDSMPGKKFFSLQKNSTLQEVSDLLNTRYVDAIDNQSLNDTAIDAILSKLDPHTVHIPARDLAQVNEDIQGSFVGIGIEYNIINDSLNIAQVISNGPAERAGILVGDIILKAGDSTISGKKIVTENVKNLLRGEDKSIIKLTIFRSNEQKLIDVKRGSITVPSVDAYYMIDNKTGYIKINKFSTQTYKEFMNGLLTLKKQQMQSLIIDLRDNGGGVLEEAVEIADELLAGDKLITYTEGTHTAKKEYRCRRQGQFETGKVVLLADEGSASASEVLLGALQDWDRATVVGRRSFGKGLVQEQYDLNDKSALRLTVARYYTPLGRSIQRSYKNGSRSYYEEISKRFVHDNSFATDSIYNDTSKIYKTKEGKKLYGSGGIRPDYFVPIDTVAVGLTTKRLSIKGTLDNFGYKYFKQKNTELSKYKNATQFVNEFTVSESDWAYFATLASKDSISLFNISAKEKAFLASNLKSAIARQLFKTEGYYESLNREDEGLKKALEVVK
jgi:carboxyl-terminal processing protease